MALEKRKVLCYYEKVLSADNERIRWEFAGGIIMKKYVCDVCGYIYDEEIGDPDNGVEAGTKWEDVPEDFLCPLCGVGKDEFSEVE